jgi:hypothetical protein
MPATHPGHCAGRGTTENELEKIANRPLTASSTIDLPNISNEVLEAVLTAFHECPLHIHVEFAIGNGGHAGCAMVSFVGVIRTGQAIAGVADGM